MAFSFHVQVLAGEPLIQLVAAGFADVAQLDANANPVTELWVVLPHMRPVRDVDPVVGTEPPLGRHRARELDAQLAAAPLDEARPVAFRARMPAASRAGP
jgi:hypothetical protein